MGFSQSVFPFVHFDLIYLSDKHTGQISMVLIPKDMQHCYETRRTTLDIPELKRNALPCPALPGRSAICVTFHCAIRPNPMELAVHCWVVSLPCK